jgi:hypothetical protein
MTRAAGWLVGGHVAATGAGAIAASLVHRGGSWWLAGRTLQLPVVRALADVVYAVVARNRHRLPGGTDACQVPGEPRTPSWALRGALMAGILTLGLVSLGMDNHGSQPYPGLILPGFGYNPSGSDGTVGMTVVRYEVTMPDGRVLPVADDNLLPVSGPAAYTLAQRVTSNAERVQPPAVRRWLAEQVDRTPQTRGAVSLTVVDVTSTYTASGHLAERTATPRTTIRLLR